MFSKKIILLIILTIIMTTPLTTAKTNTYYPNCDEFRPYIADNQITIDFTKMSMTQIQKYFKISHYNSASSPAWKITDNALQIYSPNYRGGAVLMSTFSFKPEEAYNMVIEGKFKLLSGIKSLSQIPQFGYPSAHLPFVMYGGYTNGYRYSEVITFTSWGADMRGIGFYPRSGVVYCTRVYYYPDKVIMQWYDSNCQKKYAEGVWTAPSNLVGKYLSYCLQTKPSREIVPCPYDDNLHLLTVIYDDYGKTGMLLYYVKFYKINSNEPVKLYFDESNKQLTKLLTPRLILDTTVNPDLLIDNNNRVGENIPQVNLCGEQAYGKLGDNDYLQINTNLPEGDYLIEVRGFTIDSLDYLKSHASDYGDGITLFVNGQMVQWLPLPLGTWIYSDVKQTLWVLDKSFPIKNCIGSSYWSEYAFKFYAYYHGSINNIKILEHQDESTSNEAAAIQYIKVYKVTLEKVYESDSQFSDFKAYDENGNLNHKITTISETGENVLGGGNGFGKNAKIELDKTFPFGGYLITFNYYAFDSWDGALISHESGYLYVDSVTDDNMIWAMPIDCMNYGHFPYNWLVSNGYLHELSNNYFSSTWKDRYVTVNAVYLGSINKLIWTSTLDSAGNDESFGIGKVTIYKIKEYKLVDFSKDIYIPLNVEIK